MKLTFLGAAQTVTGSCFLLEVNDKKIMVDCGMFQGSKLTSSFNKHPFLFNPAEIDVVLLTHAHIDHSGLLPRLVAEGYKGEIHCTNVTLELCTILLPDSAHIQEMDTESSNRRRRRAGRTESPPIYTIDQAYSALKHFKTHNFHEEFVVTTGVRARMLIAGHIMGAAMIEVFVEENGQTTKLVFSGDVGQPNQPILKDPEVISSADYMVIESTYGNRVHEVVDTEEVLANIINETVERGGNIIIPSFAVGRTQVLLYYLQKLYHEKRIPAIPIIIDSPLASKATAIVMKNWREFDEESKAIAEQYANKEIDLPQLRFTQSADESKALNDIYDPMIIISASGMADAGRVVHHLKHNLWRAESTVLFVGFQAEGSLGRTLLDGATKVKIFGEIIKVKAKIENMSNFSAHADKEQLVAWLKKMETKPKGFFVVHGEVDAAQSFSQELNRTLGANTFVPAFGDIAYIDNNGWQVKTAEIIESAPAIKELREELKSIEKRYISYKGGMERLLTNSPTKLGDLKRRVSRIAKFIDNIFKDL